MPVKFSTELEQNIRKDRAFMDQSLDWPHYPIWPHYPMLPLKSRNKYFGDNEHCGFLFGYLEPKPIIYFGNIWDINDISQDIKNKTGKSEVTWAEILATLKHKEYPSLDELVKDYMVD